MLIKYYNNSELSYATRCRYNKFNFTEFASEEQKSVLLGDGAYTQIKTSKNNICNYVTITDNETVTRWYVQKYIYLNGGQVTLYLQRDVIGEFGLSNCFGQIERGYTESILRNRKELELNEILTKRIPLKPDITQYGNYVVGSHDNEMWGILYIVKPSDGTTNLSINIPEFTPQAVDYEFLPQATYVPGATPSYYIEFRIAFSVDDAEFTTTDIYGNVSESVKPVYTIRITFNFTASSTGKVSFNNSASVSVYKSASPEFQLPYDLYINLGKGYSGKNNENLAQTIGNAVASKLVSYSTSTNDYYNITKNVVISDTPRDYDGVIVKNDDKYYKYRYYNSSYIQYDTTTSDKTAFLNYIIGFITKENTKISIDSIDIKDNTHETVTIKAQMTANIKLLRYTELTAEEAGTFTFDLSKSVVDEPFLVYVMPLYDISIYDSNNNKLYDISKEKAFYIYNTIIEATSGDNGQLVDAQIYPYCPILTSVACEIKTIPIFNINSSCYYHNCTVQLQPYSDIKKEYIVHEYAIISPEQSSKFTFNFYDYINNVEDNNGINYAKMNIVIKTALKPYSIISSAVIQAESGALKGLKYDSDLNGSTPSSGGFESSLSTNAYEEYVRNNSNYLSLFAIDKEELQKQNQVERVNDITSSVVNSVTAASMGAIAGGSLGDTGIFNSTGTKVAAAAAGAGVAGTVVAGAMTAQYFVNESLRNYEEQIQQQRFDLTIGTIKNLPNSVSRISSFNEIILKDFYYVLNVYECSEVEKNIVDNFIARYGYGIGVFDYVVNYYKEGWFLRSTLISSSFAMNLHEIAQKELAGGIYYYE